MWATCLGCGEIKELSPRDPYICGDCKSKSEEQLSAKDFANYYLKFFQSNPEEAKREIIRRYS